MLGKAVIDIYSKNKKILWKSIGVFLSAFVNSNRIGQVEGEYFYFWVNYTFNADLVAAIV